MIQKLKPESTQTCIAKVHLELIPKPREIDAGINCRENTGPFHLDFGMLILSKHPISKSMIPDGPTNN